MCKNGPGGPVGGGSMNLRRKEALTNIAEGLFPYLSLIHI